MSVRPHPLYSKNSISNTCNKETVKSVLDTSLLTPLGHLVNNVYPLLTFKFQIPTIFCHFVLETNKIKSDCTFYADI